MFDRKICTKCKKEKSIDCFCKNKTRKDGLTDWCKDCIAEYRASRKDAMREYTEDDVKRLCHWSNLQLLNAEDNLKKSDSLEWGLFCVE